MKIRWILLAACAALLPLADHGRALLLTPARPATAPAPAQDSLKELKESFRAAMRVNAKDEQARLVKGNQQDTINWVIQNCLQISNESSDELERETAALRAAWKTSMETDFVGQVYEYYALIPSHVRAERYKLEKAYNRLLGRLAEAKEGPDFELISGEFEGIALAFEQLGDKYFAAQCWWGVADCQDETRRKADADLRRACRCYGRYVELADEIGLRCASYHSVRQRWEYLARMGLDKKPEEGGGRAPGEVLEDASVVLTTPMRFEAVDNFGDYERPGYGLDEVYQIWPSLNFGAKGSTCRFGTMESGPRKGGPLVKRDAMAKVLVDGDGDGTPEQSIPLTGNFELVEIKLDPGPDAMGWAFLGVTGIQKDRYQNCDFNLEGNKDYLGIYVAPAASAVGTLGDVPIRIFDDNMDGAYGSVALLWNYTGTTAERSQPDLDSMIIGDGDRAQPWSQYAKVGDVWYKLEPENHGASLKATAVELDTGTLKVDYKGGKPGWLIVRGLDELGECYYDLADAGKKGLEVPVGRYEFFYGDLRKGKKQEVLKALILGGPKQPKYTVVKGETTTIKMGKPFGMLFEHNTSGKETTVLGKTVVVSGAGGEVYERLWNCRLRPEASWRKRGSKRGTRAEDFKLVENQFEIGNHGNDWNVMWFPLDLPLNLKQDVPEGVEVQVIDKKNKLFGGVTSDWLE